MSGEGSSRRPLGRRNPRCQRLEKPFCLENDKFTSRSTSLANRILLYFQLGVISSPGQLLAIRSRENDRTRREQNETIYSTPSLGRILSNPPQW